MTMAIRPVSSAPRYGNTATTNAGFVLSLLVLGAVATFGCWLVGTRGLDIGTDTGTYAAFFERLGQGLFETRLEPGFVFISYLLKRLGLGVTGYQTALFALLLLTVCLSTRRYFDYLGATRTYLTFLSASLMLLLVSPMFVNASINAVRQGLAALLVFAALLSFQQRKWGLFAVYGVIAASLHVSSLLYLAFAPALFVSARMLRYGAALAFLLYCTGLSLLLVQSLVPSLYTAVMTYTVNLDYRAGVRIDFAVFSLFWYALPLLLAPLVQPQFRERINDSTAVYLVMLLPFFAIGWGYYSNRYLLPAWLAASLIVAAILCHSRFGLLRNPLLIRMGLVASCGAFYFYVTRGLVI
jgi:EpsG-like putative glucosyltransferase